MFLRSQCKLSDVIRNRFLSESPPPPLPLLLNQPSFHRALKHLANWGMISHKRLMRAPRHPRQDTPSTISISLWTIEAGKVVAQGRLQPIHDLFVPVAQAGKTRPPSQHLLHGYIASRKALGINNGHVSQKLPTSAAGAPNSCSSLDCLAMVASSSALSASRALTRAVMLPLRPHGLVRLPRRRPFRRQPSLGRPPAAARCPPGRAQRPWPAPPRALHQRLRRMMSSSSMMTLCRLRPRLQPKKRPALLFKNS